MASQKSTTMNEIEEIRNRIHTIRGKQVMLDKDLAELYGVETKVMNQAVRRNLKRFPDDFMFQLKQEEWEILRSQIVTSSWGGVRYLPYAFTEQGVAMLSSVLRSDTAIEVNIRIMRTFVAVRQYITANRCDHCQIESKVDKLAAYIEEILADQNEINEDTRNAIAVLQAAVFSESSEAKEKRIFEMEIKFQLFCTYPKMQKNRNIYATKAELSSQIFFDCLGRRCDRITIRKQNRRP